MSNENTPEQFRSADPGGTILTRAGCLEGARLTIPLLPGMVVFAATVGSVMAQKGTTLLQAIATSALVFSGAAQMIVMDVWRSDWTAAAVAEALMITLFVNARFMLLGAALNPWLRQAPPKQQAGLLFFLTEVNWLIAMRYRAEGGRDLGIYLGSSLMIWIVWVVMVVPGYLTGAVVTDPRRYGLDLLMPIIFSAMLVPLWRKSRPFLPWMVAAAVAIAAQRLLPGYIYILAGSLAGACAGAFGRRG